MEVIEFELCEAYVFGHVLVNAQFFPQVLTCAVGDELLF